MTAPDSDSFLDDFLSRVAARLPETTQHQTGDHRLNSVEIDPAHLANAKAAAVLIPVIATREPSVILTQRARHLRSHSGQIAFPGGRMEPGETAPAAAMRETFEEIGLAPQHIRQIGALKPYLSGTGYLIHPVIGLVTPDLPLIPNPDEVSETFEVPLSFVMNETNHKIESRVWNGQTRYFYAIPYQERYIWGVTAGILRALYEGLYR
jgi:8-oxo-dGTP pyrophosphatase MutT (NUDIX family)